MIEEKKNAGNKAILLGLVLSLLSNAAILLGGGSLSLLALGGLVGLAGMVAFIWGCWQYAVGKGYSGGVGLLGLLGLIGLIVLFVLPDRQPARTATAGFSYSPPSADPDGQYGGFAGQTAYGTPTPAPEYAAAPAAHKHKAMMLDPENHWSVKSLQG